MWLTLIGLIPGLLSAFTAWQSKKVDAQVEMFKAKTGADERTARDLVVSANKENEVNVERLKVVSSNSWLTFLYVFMSLPVGLYIWQIVFFDKILCKWIYGNTCTTDPITGDGGVWVGLIIGATFGVAGIQSITKSWFGRRT